MSARSSRPGPLVVLLGGPAGAGKSSLAQAWCGTRARASRIDLDEVRQMVVGGFANPQQSGFEQTAQFDLAARQCASLARNFVQDSFDVVIESVFQPNEYQVTWEPLLRDLNLVLVVLLPDLATTLGRSSNRKKNVLDKHIRSQHAACLKWPEQNRLDTTGQSV
ncbi:MAG: AAA family ATPase, partial [Chloroflexi bacterium]|nr:AAA family ATPase [Chloroflexota bacterium]